MRKAWGFITAITLTALMAGCSTGNRVETPVEGKQTTITFWTAPNPTQLNYWTEMAGKFEAKNPDIKVEVSQIKENPTGMATLQSAIVSKTAPTMSENINRSMAAQFVGSNALVPLNELEGIDAVIEGRNMSKTIASWEFSDGNQYVLPLYSNAMLFGWRLDILKELGYDEAPQTYSQVLEVTKKLKEAHPDKFLWAKADLADPTAWMRWFDFFMLYNAVSGDGQFVANGQIVADAAAGQAVFQFISDLNQAQGILTQPSTDPFENGISLFTDLGPYTFPNWVEKYPDLVYGETFTLALPPVPDYMAGQEEIKTYADAKGIVVYAQATEEERKAAVKFLQFVFSDVEHDVALLEKTNLIPARDDLHELEGLKKIFEEQPQLAPYAKAVPAGIPPMDNPRYNELQQVFSVEGWVPAVTGQKEAAKAWEDGIAAVEKELANE